MGKYEKFLGMNFEDYMQKPQNYDVSLFNDITSHEITGMSITPKQTNFISNEDQDQVEHN